MSPSEYDDWVPCAAEGCKTYGGRLLGTTEQPTFGLARLVAPVALLAMAP